MSFYHTCEYCGANLDPGEKCDCQLSIERKIRKRRKNFRRDMEEYHGSSEFERDNQKLACIH